jgi:dTDP-4-dehydrorhamnose reductase
MQGGILVVGGAGLVGDALVRAWRARGAETAAAVLRPRGPGFLELDMRDAERVRAVLAEMRPRVVAVPAANPHVDECERRPAETRRVNVEGTLNVARACREIGARMIFFSSDYVFDGARGSYTEEDPVSPLNEYGRQKVAAERGVLDADARGLVIRTTGVYGWQAEPKNFVLQVRERLSAGLEMRVAADVRYNPTYAEDLAATVVALCESGASGVYHVVGADALARHEFAARVAAAFGLDARLVRPVPSAEFASPTLRPKLSSLRADKARAAVGTVPGGVDDGLRRMRAFEPAWREHAKSLPAAAPPPTSR